MIYKKLVLASAVCLSPLKSYASMDTSSDAYLAAMLQEDYDLANRISNISTYNLNDTNNDEEIARLLEEQLNLGSREDTPYDDINDEKIAAALQAQYDRDANISNISTYDLNDTYNDEEIARLLQEQLNLGPREDTPYDDINDEGVMVDGFRMPTINDDGTMLLDEYNPLALVFIPTSHNIPNLKTRFESNFTRHANVHHFNANDGFAPLVRALLTVDRFIYPDASFSSLKSEINDFVGVGIHDAYDGSLLTTNVVDQNLTTLQRHISGNPVETSEMKINVLDVFNRGWQLAKKLDDNADDVSHRVRFVSALAESSRTGGGCYPGFSGRLAYEYLRNILCTYI